MLKECFGRYAIIVPAIFLTYLMASNLSFLELFINLIGGILFIAVGAIIVDNWKNTRSGNNMIRN